MAWLRFCATQGLRDAGPPRGASPARSVPAPPAEFCAVAAARTGIVSGIAPPTIGTYVVSVCVYEYRNGIFIAQTRKEIHVDVANCKISAAVLDPEYLTCNGYDFTFFNKVSNDKSFTYYWDFGVPVITTDTSTLSSPTYTYPDTGYYNIKLKVENSSGCADSTTARLGIFPGFIPDFSVSGSCLLNPYSFLDQTLTNYGFVDTWKWVKKTTA